MRLSVMADEDNSRQNGSMTRGKQVRIQPSSTAPKWWATVLYLVCIAAVVIPAAISGDVPQLIASVVLGACACVAVFFRSRSPYLLVFVAWAMALAVTQMLLLPALFSLGTRRRNWLSLGAVIVSVVTLAIVFDRGERLITFQGVRIDAASGMLAWVLNAFAVVVVPYLLGLSLKVRQELLSSYAQRTMLAEQERIASDREAVLLERERISGEVHDILGHKLAIISMQAGALEVNASADPAEIERQAHNIGQSARNGLTDLRTIIGVLGQASTPSLAPHGFPAIQYLVEESRMSGAVVDMDMVGLTDGDHAPEDVGRAAYRIVQEALTNAHRHASSAPVKITLAGSPGKALSIDVRNRVNPGDRARSSLSPSGRGVSGLRERARSVGGSLTAQFDGDTFHLRAVLPWAPPPKNAQ
jgi:signal transduction histidine kinase